VVFGSADMHLLRKCPCPVWLIKPQEEIKLKRILAAVDIQPTTDEEKMEALNQQILEMATSLALSEFAELHIVHAWMIFGESLIKSDRFGGLKDEVNEWIEQQKKEITAGHDAFLANIHQLLGDKGSEYIQPETHFIQGDAIDVIPKISKEKNIDLVIMGTVARTGIPGILMGNTSENILTRLDCSVLAIKPKGFISPVTI
jgi:nucleotide-binding universal stress UspA family protein